MSRLDTVKKDIKKCIEWYLTFKGRKPNMIPVNRSDYELLRSNEPEYKRLAYPKFVLCDEVKVVPKN
jgi:hypothetical protein